MKITWSKSRNVKQFADVNETDCFTVPDEDGVFVNRVYMKIEAHVFDVEDDFNAVTLTNGEVTWFDDEDEVYPLDVELKVNDFMP
jgi:hypothetical protein